MGKKKNQTASTASTSGAPQRRRGRPTGVNRVPLTREERRARNAQNVKERRMDTAALMALLAEVVDSDPQISNVALLATVIRRIQNAATRESEDIEDLERINSNLEALQIATAQDRLGLQDADVEALDDDVSDPQPSGSQQS